MFLLIVVSLLFVTGIAFAIKYRKDEDKQVLIVGVAVALIALIALLGTSFSTVPSGQVGLRVKFGKVQEGFAKEGLNIKIPFVEKIIKVDSKLQTRTIDEHIAQVMTKDQVPTTGQYFRVQFVVSPENAKDLYITYGEDFKEEVIEFPQIKGAFTDVIADLTAEEVSAGGDLLVNEPIAEKLQEKLDMLHGEGAVIIRSVHVGEVNLSEGYREAVAKKVEAEENLQTSQKENARRVAEAETDNLIKKEQAQNDAEVARIKAENDAEIQRIEAEATADANKTVTESITQELLDLGEVEARKKHGWVTVQGGTPVTVVD